LNIRWRRRPLRIVAADGPERIAPEWWTPVALAAGLQERARTRDYWRVEDTTGRRLWLYREGLYDAAGARTEGVTESAATKTLPRWYVHGLFA
jgi:protein ImuB